MSIFSAIGHVVGSVAGLVSHAGIPLVSGIAGDINSLIKSGASPSSVGVGSGGLPPYSPVAGGGGVQLLTAGATYSNSPWYANAPAGPGSVPTPGFYHGTLSRILPGGETGYSAAPPGYHINKAYKEWYISSQRGGHRQQPAVKNVIVKNRRMNPTNPRALRAAIRRERAFVGMAKAVLKGSGYTVKRTGLPSSRKRRVGARRR